MTELLRTLPTSHAPVKQDLGAKIGTAMSDDKINPIRPTDGTARALARDLMAGARIAALGVTDPDNGGPHVSRIALFCTAGAGCVTLISDLAFHTRGIGADRRVSLLFDETGGNGDPLTHPRLTIRALAEMVTDGTERAALRALWLRHVPKAKLYIDFTDFHFVRFHPLSGLLNAGFGKAYDLDKKDLTLLPGRGNRFSD